MAVAVNNPIKQDTPNQPQGKEKESDLDKIMKALQIANLTFGIVGDVDKIRTNSVQRDQMAQSGEQQKKQFSMAEQSFQQESQIKNQQLTALQAAAEKEKRMAKGELTPLEAGEFISKNKYSMAKGPEDAQLTLNVMTQQGPRPVYLRKPEDLENQLNAAKIKTQGAIANKYTAEAGKLNRDRTSQDGLFKRLPKENQTQIEKLADKNANLFDIQTKLTNYLDLAKNPKISTDQKIKKGQELAKVINSASTSNPDAVGKEEAERLLSFLEFKWFNTSQPGSFVGRDLGDFEQQIGLLSDNLGSSIGTNADMIDRLYTGQSLRSEGSRQGQYDKIVDYQNQNKGFNKSSPKAINEAVAGPEVKFNPNKPFKVVR